MAVTCALLGTLSASFAQAPDDPAAGAPDTQQATPLLSPDQLNNMVAPIALYPDPLLSQVLSASTYPLEIVQAQQWLAQNNRLKGTQLVEAAKQQNWDPSVQALVVFPNALALLANDIRWTTDLGNAFLAQQADVMSAVQRMRARAKANGKLTTTPQQVVTTDRQDGQDAIVIQPADPQVIYVPVYSPNYVWGPPVWGAYPSLWYPAGFGFGFGFGPAYYMSSYYPSWGGWSGWGWGCGWFGGGLYVNVGFYNRYGYYGGGYGHHGGYGGGGGYGGRSAWMHNSGHRMGVPYPNRTVANRFNGGQYNSGRPNGGQYAGGARGSGGQWSGSQYNSGRAGSSQFNGGPVGSGTGGVRSPATGGWRSFGDGNRSSSTGVNSGFNRQASPNYPSTGGSRSYQSPTQSARGFGPAQGRSSSPDYSTPRGTGSASSRSYSAPQSYSGSRGTGGGGYSSPRSYSTPSQSFSAPQSYSGSRGTGGGGYSASRSYSAPSRNFSAPQSFSGSRGSGGGGFSAPRSYSAPSQSFSAPRMSGGGSGFSGGRSGGSSGFSGGRSGGAGGGGGGHRR